MFQLFSQLKRNGKSSNLKFSVSRAQRTDHTRISWFPLKVILKNEKCLDPCVSEREMSPSLTKELKQCDKELKLPEHSSKNEFVSETRFRRFTGIMQQRFCNKEPPLIPFMYIVPVISRFLKNGLGSGSFLPNVHTSPVLFLSWGCQEDSWPKIGSSWSSQLLLLFFLYVLLSLRAYSMGT